MQLLLSLVLLSFLNVTSSRTLHHVQRASTSPPGQELTPMHPSRPLNFTLQEGNNTTLVTFNRWPRDADWPFGVEFDQQNFGSASAQIRVIFMHPGPLRGRRQTQYCEHAFSDFLDDNWSAARRNPTEELVEHEFPELNVAIAVHIPNPPPPSWPKWDLGESAIEQLWGKVIAAAGCRSMNVRIDAKYASLSNPYRRLADLRLAVSGGPDHNSA